MKKTKKMVALALAVSMAAGSSFVAIAADNEGSTSGTGAVEGHVDQEVLNVVLPTVDASSSLFSYTMDPERLIQGTDAAKYEEGTVFPEKATDTGVYFLTGSKTYSNTSNKYQVVNKSSCDVTLTVKVKATQNTAKDITLVSGDPATTGTAPELYLGLKVGNDNQAVTSTEATITKTIAGTKGNFNIAVATEENGDKKYVYTEKANASSWKAMELSLTGKVSQMTIANDTTAPTVDVTWSWEKAADGVTADADAVDFLTDAAPSIATVSYVLEADTPVEVAVSLGGGSLKATTVSKVTDNAGKAVEKGTQWDYSDGKVTFTQARVNALLSAKVDKVYTIHFDDEAKTKVNVTLKGSGQ